ASVPDGRVSAGDHRRTLEHNTWPRNRAKFGWIGFRDIEPLVANGRYFGYARPFLDAKRSRRVTIREAGKRCDNIQTKPWEGFSPTIRLRDCLRSVIKQSVTVARIAACQAAAQNQASDAVDARKAPETRRLSSVR